MSQEKLLAINGLTKRFGGLIAVNDVNIEVKKGEILGLIGPNGSGKTTIFNVITGLYSPDGGTITFKSERIEGLKPYKIAQKGIGRTFQVVRPFGNMSVLENIMVSGMFCAHKEEKKCDIEDRCHRLLKLTNLEDRVNENAEMLSLAEKRRLEIARALALDPGLLLLDETMAGLTHTEVDEALTMMENIKREYDLTIMVVEHIMRAIMRISERIVVLNEGKIIAEGAPEKVANDKNVLEAYLGKKVV
ncbi:MAG: ABC transporter ATP-binding protein [Candidatus Bathyarchaeota archaeon]|nr:ABC transporter ATP-binding protein [Candidatus Bathyarchaeota archaeon]